MYQYTAAKETLQEFRARARAMRDEMRHDLRTNIKVLVYAALSY